MKKIDNHYAALRLIEVLHNKNMINNATYENIKAHYPEGFSNESEDFFKGVKALLVKDVEN